MRVMTKTLGEGFTEFKFEARSDTFFVKNFTDGDVYVLFPDKATEEAITAVSADPTDFLGLCAKISAGTAEELEAGGESAKVYIYGTGTGTVEVQQTGTEHKRAEDEAESPNVKVKFLAPTVVYINSKDYKYAAGNAEIPEDVYAAIKQTGDADNVRKLNLYAITVTVTGGTEDDENPASVWEDGTAVLSFDASDGYEDGIVVDGVTGAEYEAEGDDLTISDPTDDVTVEVHFEATPAPVDEGANSGDGN